MIRRLALIALAAAVALLAAGVGQARTHRPTLRQLRAKAERGVVREIHQHYFLLRSSRDLRPRLSVRCSPLTRARWKCTWRASRYRLGKPRTPKVTYDGKARATIYRYAVDVRLSRTICLDLGSDITGGGDGVDECALIDRG